MTNGSLGHCRLEFEARNQKKEAKELAVLEAMKRREEAAAKPKASPLCQDDHES